MADVLIVTTIPALKAVPTTTGAVSYLAEAGREGNFVWRSGDHTAQVASDPLEGLYIKSDATPSSAGAWVRDWDGVHGRPEWFHAGGFWDAAMDACYTLCPVSLLQAREYKRLTTWILDKFDRTIEGAHPPRAVGGTGTTITLDASSPVVHTADLCRVGFLTRPSSPNPETGVSGGFLSSVHISNVRFVRDGTYAVNADRRQACAGVRIKYVSHCHLTNVVALNNAVGFYLGGCIYTKLDDCYARNENTNTSGNKDYSTGYYLDGSISFGYAGGNASIYLNRCLAFMGMKSPTTDPLQGLPIGLLAEAAFVDTFMSDFEVAGTSVGVVFDGTGAPDFPQNGDVHMRGTVIDGVDVVGIELKNLSNSAAIDISDFYIASNGAGQFGLLVRDGGGFVTISHGQIILDFAKGALYLARQSGVRIAGTKIPNTTKPVVVDGCNITYIDVQVLNTYIYSNYFIFTTLNCNRCEFSGTLTGFPGRFAGGYDVTNGSRCTFNLTRADPGSFTQSGQPLNIAGKLRYNGSPVTTDTFGADHRRIGILN